MDKKKLMNFKISVKTHAILKECCDKNCMSMTATLNMMILNFISKEENSPIHNDEPLDFFVLR